jgi:tRNA1Val (adenine37-N6)-methyltransferase
MSNNYFSFKEFTIYQDKSAFRVGTDGVLLGAAAEVSDKKMILDIGCGTGLISIMLAQRSQASIVSIEPDEESFKQAVENVRICKWNKRITVLNTDLQSYDPGGIKFDLIVSNPPYFSDSLKNPDPRKSAARHNDNLTSQELLEHVAMLLEKNGCFQVIMPYVEGNVLVAEAQQFGLYCIDILKIRPLPTSEVRRLILTFSAERMKATERFLTIEKGARHQFTDEYISLTKDFYLKF